MRMRYDRTSDEISWSSALLAQFDEAIFIMRGTRLWIVEYRGNIYTVSYELYVFFGITKCFVCLQCTCAAGVPVSIAFV